MTEREERRLQRDKAILSRQSQVLLKLPSKRERAEVSVASYSCCGFYRISEHACAMSAEHKMGMSRIG